MVGWGNISTEGNLRDIGSISISGKGDSGKSQGANGCPPRAYDQSVNIYMDNYGGCRHDCICTHVIEPFIL